MFVIGDWPGSGGTKITLEHLHALYDAGWTVGNHTIDHTDLGGRDQATAAAKIQQGHDWLIANGFGRTADFFAWPFNDTSQSAIAAAAASGVVAARQGGYHNEYMPIDEALQLAAFPFDDEPQDLDAWKHRIDLAIANGGTLIVNAHRFDFRAGDLALFHGIVDYLHGQARVVSVDR